MIFFFFFDLENIGENIQFKIQFQSEVKIIIFFVKGIRKLKTTRASPEKKNKTKNADMTLLHSHDNLLLKGLWTIFKNFLFGYILLIM